DDLVEPHAVANIDQALGDLAGDPEAARAFDARAHHAGIAERPRLRRGLDHGDLHRPHRLFLADGFALAAAEPGGKPEHTDAADQTRHLGQPEANKSAAHASNAAHAHLPFSARILRSPVSPKLAM